MNIPRRHFLKSGLACGAFSAGWLRFLGQHGMAQDGNGTKKLLFIFQRGGNDGVNTVIPRGDSEYNSNNRPNLFIPETDAIDLGNGFAQLHPMMAPMMELYNHSSLNGVAGIGNLAVIHRVAYANQSRSHFDSQDYWERGVPDDPTVKDGMFYRQLDLMADLSAPENSFCAASISGSQMIALKGANPFPNFRDSGDFNVLGTPDYQAKFLGSLPSAPGAQDGRGLLGLYGGTTIAGAKYGESVHATGESLGKTIQSLSLAGTGGEYVPENGAVYPNGRFGEKLQEAAMLFKRTEVKILGVNIDGWDTHSGQGQIYGDQGDLLQDVAGGYLALYRDLQSQWDDLIIVTMTEFGRTSRENGSAGTDHAEASVMFCAGGGVNGGVYNCDATTWADGDMFSKRDRYVERKTDFRAVFGEIFMKHFGDSRADLDTVIPGYTFGEEDYPNEFTHLGFMA